LGGGRGVRRVLKAGRWRCGSTTIVQRAVGGESDDWPFRLRRTGAAFRDRFFCCWKRHTKVRWLSILAETNFGYSASDRVVSHSRDQQYSRLPWVSVRRLPKSHKQSSPLFAASCLFPEGFHSPTSSKISSNDQASFVKVKWWSYTSSDVGW
jgi:hypothetical protein